MTTKGIHSKLNKYLEKHFTPEEIYEMEWHTDWETDTYYKWKFELKGITHVLTFDKIDKRVYGFTME